jgi:hypothetical protein
MKNFYLVYNVEENQVYGSFDTTDEAIKSAKKLAENNAGKKEFYVCSGLYGYSSRIIITEPEFICLESSQEILNDDK